MKNLKKLGLLTSLIALMSTSAFAQEVGVNSAMRGSVLIDESETDVGDDVSLGEEVETGEDSSLQILLLDETVFTVGAETILTIDEFVYDPDQSSGELAASVAQGTFRFMSGGTADDVDDVEIETETASMGVRGTIIEGVVGARAIELAAAEGIIPATAGNASQGATIVMLRGPGRHSNSLNKRGAVDITSGGMTKTLRTQGTAYYVPRAGEFVGPFEVTTSMWDFMSGNLRTSPAQATDKPVPPIDNAHAESGDDTFDANPDPFDPRSSETIPEWPTTTDDFGDNGATDISTSNPFDTE
ncbi:MAG: FecR domain-containing protein [Parvularculaceae bacterium]